MSSSIARGLLKRHEQQYSYIAGERRDQHKPNRPVDKTINPNRSPKGRCDQEGSGPSIVPTNQGGQNPTEERTDRNRGQGLQCQICHHFGHIARFCREKGKQGAEALGRSRQITEASRKPKDSGSSLQVQGIGKFSIQELEQQLLQRRLASEQQLADTHVESSANMVTGAVGSSYWLDIAVEGMVAPALVDTASQSTIISRTFLHKVFAHMTKSGKTPPRLEYPIAKLKGKGGDSIPVTPQVTLRVNVDEISTSLPAFIQLDSKQECLLGSNVLPALGISVVRANGQPLVPRQDKGGVQVASVNLIQAAAIPGLKGCFVQARVDMVQSDGECLLLNQSTSPWIP